MAEYVRDTFTRTAASGWGTAEVGGAWTESLVNVLSSQAANQFGRLQLQVTANPRACELQAAATTSRDVALAVHYALAPQAVAIPAWFFVRTSGPATAPIGYFAKLTVNPDGSATLAIGHNVGGTDVILGSAAFPAGTWTSTANKWRVELQATGAPSRVRARVYDATQPAPASTVGWITAGDEAGPQVAGFYGLVASRAGTAAASTFIDVSDFYVTDPPVPAFSYTASGLGISVNAAPSTGDFTAWSWNWGDGTAAGSGATASHTYAEPGTWKVTLTATTRWGAAYTGAAYVTVAAPPPAPPDLVPVVRIDGVNVCDELFAIDWSLGRDHWVDAFSGLTCSLRLRGRYVASQGMTVTVAVPNAVSGVPLWSGVIDEVSETREADSARDETLVVAMDAASRLARRHYDKDGILGSATLPGRLDDLRIAGVTYAYRYSGSPVAAGRWLQLKKKTQKADKLQERTYLDLVSDALAASLAFAYVGRDGAIAYAPWEAPPGLPSTPVLNLDTGIDCPSRVAIQRRTPDGMVNSWVIGGGDDYYERKVQSSIEDYGERAYSVSDEVLVLDSDFPFAVTRWEGTGNMVASMAIPSRALVVDIPVTDWAQKAITTSPLDFATFNGKLYSVMGVRHSLTVGDAWRTQLTLDRNPWEIDGRTPP